MTMRAMCHCKMRATCSRREGSLHYGFYIYIVLGDIVLGDFVDRYEERFDSRKIHTNNDIRKLQMTNEILKAYGDDSKG